MRKLRNPWSCYKQPRKTDIEKHGWGLSKIKKDNLLILADWLEQNKPKPFTMDWDSEGFALDYAIEVQGIEAKIVDYDDYGCLSYTQYAQRVFIGWGWNKPTLDYLFSADWQTVDNTLSGAIKRIRYVANNGLPETFDKEIYEGFPLSYKPQTIFNPFESTIFNSLL